MARLLSGTPPRDAIKATLVSAVSSIPEHERPRLSIIQAGDDEASNVYIKGKIRFGEEIGISVDLHHFADEASQDDPSGIVPATTRGIFSLFSYYDIDIKDKKVLVIGRSDLVGKPTAQACMNAGAIVSVAHKATEDIPALCKAADIIISITGASGLITEAYVKPEHIIIDVGITRKDGKIVGDVDFEPVSAIVSAITPVPGGIGLLTIASLFQNLLKKYT